MDHADDEMRIPKSAFALVVIAAVLWAFGTLAFATAPSGYRFRILKVQVEPHGQDSIARVQYATEWEGSEFPGWLRCQLEVVDNKGSVLGEQVYQMADLTRSPSSKEAVIPLRTSQGLSSVRGSCDTSRLDDESGYYEFSNLRVERNDVASADFRTFDVTFDETWIGGGGLPGIRHCTLLTFDGEGQPLFDYEFSFADASGGGVNRSMLVVLDEPTTRDPSTSEIHCAGF